MIGPFAIALAAGAASALMFASMMSGEAMSLVLICLAPLPLMVAGLGWGPLSAAIGSIAAAIGVGAMFGIGPSFSFVITVAAPAWWLSHLVLLGRPVAGPDVSGRTGGAGIEWYPLGHIVIWIVAIAALTTAVALLMRGTDAETITTVLRRSLSRLLQSSGIPASSETDQGIEALVAIGPTLAVAFVTIRLTVTLWLAAKIAAISGSMRRPWPDLRETTLPPMTLAALFAVLAFSFSGGLLGLLAKVATSAILMAYALTGFAVLHILTLTWRSRTIWLSLTYVLVTLIWWPMLAMVGLGLADAAFGLRQRFWQRRRPPPLPFS